jgi:hypothetical protein
MESDTLQKKAAFEKQAFLQGRSLSLTNIESDTLQKAAFEKQAFWQGRSLYLTSAESDTLQRRSVRKIELSCKGEDCP